MSKLESKLPEITDWRKYVNDFTPKVDPKIKELLLKTLKNNPRIKTKPNTTRIDNFHLNEVKKNIK
jgi:hypothetical protein